VHYRPDLEQEAVIEDAVARCVVVAPPGTGKTALAARLAARDADAAAAHERVLVLTFSNQAQGRLETEANATLTRLQRQRVVVTNYHKFFWSAITAYATALGLPTEYGLSSSRRRLSILRGADSAAVESLETRRYLLDSIAEQAHPDLAPQTGLSDTQTERLLSAVAGEHARGHLVFDDFGALFWTLLKRFPAVRAAYKARYPFLIADEHQDASGLQDAVVREFGNRRRVVLADPMQLIHGWRGADEQRLQAHRLECEREYTLNTPHRWHGDEADLGQWLLDVRKRLWGEPADTPAPRQVRVVATEPTHGHNGMLSAARMAVHRALEDGSSSVAVLARTRDDVVRLRDHLTSRGLRPRQIGATDSFERSISLIEELPELRDRDLASRALEAICSLVPSVDRTVQRQAAGRLGPAGLRKAGAGREALPILEAIEQVYLAGREGFFSAVVDGCRRLVASGHHMPSPDEYALYEVVARAELSTFADQLSLFGARVGAMTRTARRSDRGVLTMTIHQAKGREFDSVILYSALDTSFRPTRDDIRLFYVAVTRGIRDWTFVTLTGRQTPLLAALKVPGGGG
jgi:superfamily I DNA/RNA helicase